VAPGGTYSNYGFAGGWFTEIDRDEAARRGVTAIGMEQLVEGWPHRKKWARRVLEEAAADRIRPLIGQTCPLEHAAEAHAAIENRESIRKTLIRPDPRRWHRLTARSTMTCRHSSGCGGKEPRLRLGC
jgi:NADPH2:quinone reductase